MIIFNFKDKELFEKSHLSLMGSQAYIDSEITIEQDKSTSQDGFQIVIGGSNSKKLRIDINEKTVYIEDD